MRCSCARAKGAGEAPNFIDMIRGWGGVTLAYRKRLQEAPAYRLNHEEVALALQEGIAVTENMNPVEAIPDQFGHVTAMVFTRADGSRIELPARTVLVAAGTVPNVTYEKEHPGSFSLDNKQKFFKGFKAVKTNNKFTLEPDANGFFTSHETDGKFVSYYGDNHPRYNGNVVKAMASAKHGYPRVVELFADDIAEIRVERRTFAFRYPSPKAYLDYWRRYYGPTLKAFDAVGEDGRAALEADLLDVIARFNRADDGTMIVPNEYLEVVIVKR